MTFCWTTAIKVDDVQPVCCSSVSGGPSRLTLADESVMEPRRPTIKRVRLQLGKMQLGTTDHHGNAATLFFTRLLSPFLDYLDIGTVQLVGAVNRHLRYEVKRYIESRYHRTIRPWIKNPRAFRNEMRYSGSLIAGSVVIDMILREPWAPDDLNIYVPRHQAARLVSYLMHQEGYEADTFLRAEQSGIPSHELSNSSVHSVTRLIKRSNNETIARIDITEAKDNYAFSPVLQSTSTWAYNWMTADGLTIAYPTLTLKKFGVSRKRHPLPGQRPTTQWKQKYVDARGFTSVTQRQWRGDRPCGSTCRAKIRSTEDSSCLTILFGSNGDRSAYPLRVWAIKGLGSTLACQCSNIRCPFYRLTPWDVNAQSTQIFWNGSYS